MEYLCLDCGYKWEIRVEIPRLRYRRCPNLGCRSSKVIPACFWKMVEEGRRLGIRHDTPFRDLIKVAQAVDENLLGLGWLEFRRIMGCIMREIENPRMRAKTAIIGLEKMT